jgi:Putative transposase
VPFPLRFPLVFDGKLLGQVVRIFTDTVATWYQKRHVERGLPPGESGAVTVIHRANSDLRLNPQLHTIFLDGVYAPDRDGKGQMFHPAPSPSQREVEAIVCPFGV